jgi:hypothetical protein
LIRVHSIAEKKITTTKRKEASFFYILAEGDAGNRGIFDCAFYLNFFWVSPGARGRGSKFKSLCIFGSEKLMCGSIVRIKFLDQVYK